MAQGQLQIYKVGPVLPGGRRECAVRSVGDVPVRVGDAMRDKSDLQAHQPVKVAVIQRGPNGFVHALETICSGLVEFRGPDVSWVAVDMILESEERPTRLAAASQP